MLNGDPEAARREIDTLVPGAWLTAHRPTARSDHPVERLLASASPHGNLTTLVLPRNCSSTPLAADGRLQ
jgi:hypothetical protein